MIQSNESINKHCIKSPSTFIRQTIFFFPLFIFEKKCASKQFQQQSFHIHLRKFYLIFSLFPKICFVGVIIKWYNLHNNLLLFVGRVTEGGSVWFSLCLLSQICWISMCGEMSKFLIWFERWLLVQCINSHCFTLDLHMTSNPPVWSGSHPTFHIIFAVSQLSFQDFYCVHFASKSYHHKIPRAFNAFSKFQYD